MPLAFTQEDFLVHCCVNDMLNIESPLRSHLRVEIDFKEEYFVNALDLPEQFIFKGNENVDATEHLAELFAYYLLLLYCIS